MNPMLDQYVETICNYPFNEPLLLQKAQTDDRLDSEGNLCFFKCDMEDLFTRKDAKILLHGHLSSLEPVSHPHKHPWNELIYVHAGIFHMSVSGMHLVLHAGNFILLNQNVPHSYKSEANSQVISIICKESLLQSEFFHMILGNSMLTDFLLPSLTRTDTPKHFLLYYDRMEETSSCTLHLTEFFKEHLYPQSELLHEWAEELSLASLFLDLSRNHLNIQVPLGSSGSAPVRKGLSATDLLDYLENNLQTATLSQSAAHFGYNTSYFSRMVKSVFGVNFKTLLQELRLVRAAGMLVTSSLPVTEIAHQCGYNNVTWFYQLFEEKYQVLPAAYRRSHKAA